LQDYSSNLKTKEIINKIKISKEHKIDLQKPRSYTFDTKNSNSNNIPIKINLGNLNFFGNNKMKNYINLLGNNDISTENRKNIFLNTNNYLK
jgi:hypothetical protein